MKPNRENKLEAVRERKATGCRIPAGAAFMPQVRLKRTKRMVDRERDGTERSRLQATKMRKAERSIGEIAGELCNPSSTVHDWLVRMHRRGPRVALTVLDGARLAGQDAPERA